MKRLSIACLLWSSLAFSACGSDADDNTPKETQNNKNDTNNKQTNNQTKRDGQVKCGTGVMGEEVKCSANQYCADAVLARCEIGCLSDDNCTFEQKCIKESAKNIGTCQTFAKDPCEGIQCEANQQCREGKCFDISTDPCENVQCNANEVCQNGQCKPTSTQSCTITLTAQDGCANDAICVLNPEEKSVCRAFEPCDANNKCAPGLDGALCSSEVITGKTPQCLVGACKDNTHCPNQTFCVVSASDPFGECSKGLVNDICVDNNDCANDLICDIDPNQEDYGSCIEDSSCKTDANCPNNWFCVKPDNAESGTCSEGRVTATCYEENDCIEALTCDLFVPGEPGICVEGF